MDIGKIIKEKRLENNLTQEELAQKFFVTRQLISKWENGKSYPDLEQVVKISEMFDISLDALLKDDQEIVKELSFDRRLKKLFKLLLLLLSAVLISMCSIWGFKWWRAGERLEKDEITVTKITKRVLPSKVIKNKTTGEKITLPEDVEYTIHFKTDKWLVHLPEKRAGYKNQVDDNNIELTIKGKYKLFGANKESTVVITTDRERNLNNPQLNINKNIYVQNQAKEDKAFRENTFSKGFPRISQVSDKLVDKEELAELPEGSK